MEDSKVLSGDQIKVLEDCSQEMRLMEKDVVIAQLRNDLVQKELSLLSANYTLKSKQVTELKNELTKVKEKQKKQNEKRLKLIKQITDDLDLPKKWGYDPMTGEIK